MKKKFQIVCLCMFVFALLVAGCGGSSTKKELIVGTEPAFAPFEFQKRILKILSVLILTSSKLLQNKWVMKNALFKAWVLTL